MVERAFRSRDGGLRVLVATTGVAAGINTPASTVIIAETAFRSGGDAPMSVGDVRNTAGRAGRFGYRETKRAIILADTPYPPVFLMNADGAGTRTSPRRRLVTPTPTG